MRIPTLLFLLSFAVNLYPQKTSAVLLKKETNIEIVGSKLISTNYFEVLINNKAGDKYTHIEIPYSGISRISNISGQIFDLDKNEIYKLKNSDIEDNSRLSNSTFFDDIRVKSFYLSHNNYPYKITYSFTTTLTEFIQIADWYPLIDNDIKTISASLVLTVPEGYEIDIRERGLSKGEVNIQKKNRTYLWETSYKGDIEEETFAPSIYETLPNVLINPIEFSYEIEGSLRSWKDLGDWQYKTLSNIIDLSNEDFVYVRSISESIDDKKEKTRILYHFLQDNTRYVNVSLNTGGLKPYSSSYVSEKKYGDCKALSNYFRNILKAAGIESYYTKVYAGSDPIKIERDYPGQQFNHIILLVPLEQDSLWLDCTSKGPFAYLGTFTQNRQVLVVKEGDSEIIKTPALSCEEVNEDRNIVIKYNGGESSTAILNCTYRGDKFESIRSIESNYNKSDQDIIYRNFLKSEGLETINYQIKPFDRDDRKVSITSTANCLNIYRKYGNEILVKNLAFDLPEIEETMDRNNSIRIVQPISYTDTIYYENPIGYVFDKQDDIDNNTLFGSYSWQSTIAGKRIMVVKKFTLLSGEYNRESYNALYTYINSALRNEKRTYLIFSKPIP